MGLLVIPGEGWANRSTFSYLLGGEKRWAWVTFPCWWGDLRHPILMLSLWSWGSKPGGFYMIPLSEFSSACFLYYLWIYSCISWGWAGRKGSMLWIDFKKIISMPPPGSLNLEVIRQRHRGWALITLGTLDMEQEKRACVTLLDGGLGESRVLYTGMRLARITFACFVVLNFGPNYPCYELYKLFMKQNRFNEGKESSSLPVCKGVELFNILQELCKHNNSANKCHDLQ